MHRTTIAPRRPRVAPSSLLSCAFTALCLATAAGGAAGAQDSATATPPEKPASTGVYTEAQAQRGETAYNTSCLECHSAKAYTGDDFKLAWVSRRAFDLFDRISSTMPDDNPGILPRQDYVDIVAYMFSLNGYPKGGDELPADDDGLKRVRIDSLPGMPGTTGASHGAWSARLLRKELRAKARR